ncbi:MAG: hypothetical protein N2D54_12310 [Chloroflexota bacterium]
MDKRSFSVPPKVAKIQATLIAGMGSVPEAWRRSQASDEAGADPKLCVVLIKPSSS